MTSSVTDILADVAQNSTRNIVVVGGGLHAVAAAIRLAESGTSVKLIYDESVVGQTSGVTSDGNTVVSPHSSFFDWARTSANRIFRSFAPRLAYLRRSIASSRVADRTPYVQVSTLITRAQSAGVVFGDGPGAHSLIKDSSGWLIRRKMAAPIRADDVVLALADGSISQLVAHCDAVMHSVGGQPDHLLSSQTPGLWAVVNPSGTPATVKNSFDVADMLVLHLEGRDSKVETHHSERFGLPYCNG